MLREMREYIKKLESMGMDVEGRLRAKEQIAASGITVNDGPVAFSYVPLLITEEDMAAFDAVIVGIQRILDKMTIEYVKNPEYRKLFGFSKEMEELICLPCDYPCIIPFGRYDLFYDFVSGNYGFCEINTDGSGGMSWNDRITEAILAAFADQEYLEREQIRMLNATEAFADGILETYRSSPSAVEDPLISIVDFKEEGVLTDFDGIIEALKRRGVRARFTDVRDLAFEGGVLKDKKDGAVVHGIYRRAVTSVVLERLEECRDLIEAVRAERVVLMGHFRTSLAHSKKVFSVMYRPETWQLLTEEEINWVRDHVPATYILREGLLSQEELEEVRKNPTGWVLKPEEGFGSYGVCCGMDVDQEEWERQLSDALEKRYILQAFCERYTIPVLRSQGDTIEEVPLMLGIFQTNGHASCCYSRAAAAGVIDYSHGCVCVATATKYR